MILFRSLYEGLVIILFLYKHPNCEEKFAYSSLWKIINIFNKTNLQNVHDEIMKSVVPSLDASCGTDEFSLHQGLEKYSSQDLLSSYGWAKEGFKDASKYKKIEFIDILDDVFPDDDYKVMYRMASSFVHSNISCPSAEIMKEISKGMVSSYMENFCIPVIIDIFMTYLLNDKEIEKYVFRNVWGKYKNGQHCT